MTTITLYKTNISPQKNMWIDDIENYLSSCESLDVPNSQYWKLEKERDYSIKFNQGVIHSTNTFNYLKVHIIETSGLQGTYYYFITNMEWRGEYTLGLHCVLDTVNTYMFDDSDFSDQTTIIRQHRDRFLNGKIGDNNIRKVDLVDEGIAPIKYKIFSKIITDPKLSLKSNTSNFYLIYKNRILSPENIANPVECFLTSDYPFVLKKGTGTYPAKVLTAEDLTPGMFYYIYNPGDTFNRGDLNFNNIINNTTTWCYYRDGDKIRERFIEYEYINGIRVVKTTGLPPPEAATVSKITLYQCKDIAVSNTYINSWNDIDKCTKQLINAGNITDIFLKTIDEIDRSDPLLIKILKLPYAPGTFNVDENDLISYNSQKWTIENGMFKLLDLNTEFLNKLDNTFDYSEMSVNIPKDSNGKPQIIPKDSKYESKLFHSAFYTSKITYDNVSYNINYEEFRPRLSALDGTYETSISFKMTNTMNSNMLFKINYLDEYFKTTQDYPFIMLSNRNVETTILNSAYVNYIQSGYNYDRENQTRSNIINWLNTGLQVAGSVASFAISGVTGGFSSVAGISLATSAIGSISSNINSTINAGQSIKQKLSNAQLSSINISGASDIDLMSSYTEYNKLIQFKYDVSDTMKSSLFDLFYYCGYSYPVKETPNTTSRIFFNFIQCDPVFNQSFLKRCRNEYIEDLISRFKLGVTRYHKKDNTYDLLQEKENWEVKLYE